MINQETDSLSNKVKPRRRRLFANPILKRKARSNNFVDQIIASNEVHFQLHFSYGNR